jgi:hypothetical protein
MPPEQQPTVPPPPPLQTIVPASVHDAAVITKEDHLKEVMAAVVKEANEVQTQQQKPFLFGLPSWANTFLQMGAVGVLCWLIMVRMPAQDAQYHQDLTDLRAQFHDDLKDIRDTDEKRLQTMYQLLAEVKKVSGKTPE